MKTRRSFLRGSALTACAAPWVVSAPCFGADGPARKRTADRGGPLRDLDLNAVHKGTVEIDRRILELSDPSPNVRGFFADARQIFETHRNAAFADLPELREAAERHGLAVFGGPMLGAVTHDGARVWVRTVQPARVEVTVRTDSGERRFGPVASTAAGDLAAVVPVTGLVPAMRHPYRVLVDGSPIPMPADAAISTAPAPERPGRLTLAFGSCLHKTGLGNRALLDRVRARGASALLLLGDSAVDDRDGHVGLHRSDYLLRDLHTGWRDLAASAAVYAAWDDHDYFNNDRSGIPPGATGADRDAVRAVWTQNWNNPAYGFADRGEGIFFRTRLGPCDLIMLDTRSLRTQPGEPDAFLGGGQMRWLERELAACTGPFVILTGGTMWSDNISNGKDSWGVWDRPGRERIFSLIESKRLPVILLSGDRHGARVIEIPRPSGHVLREFELGSLGAHPGPPAFGTPKEGQPFGVTEEALFGECTFDTAPADPTATIRIVDAAGTERWRTELSRSRLTPPRAVMASAC
jgi:alkaline phosphatase D